MRERFLVGLAALLLVGGLYAFKSMVGGEAYPYPSPPTIEVIAQNAGWSAEEMERQITTRSCFPSLWVSVV